MTPQRMQASAIGDTVAAFGAVTLGTVALDLFAPANVILVALFIAAVMLNFLAGTMRSFALHRRSGSDGQWFSAQRASFGVVKKFALLLFVPLAGVVDGMFMVSETTRTIGQLTPAVKGVLVALTGAQVIGAARSLHVVVGDDAMPALSVLIRAVDRAHADGPLPHRRVTDEIIDAHLPERERDR